MDENYFAQKYGYADASPAENPAPVKTQTTAPSGMSDDYFAQKYGYDDPEPAPAKPAPAKPGILQGALDFGNSALKGAEYQVERTVNEPLALAAATPAILVDKISSLISGHDSTEAQDAWFKTVVDPSVARQAAEQLGPDASTKDKVAHALGQTLGVIGEVVATGGGAAPEVGATETAAEGVRQLTAHGIQSMSVPAVGDAVDTGRQVLAETGDGDAAIKAAQMKYLTTALSGIQPMSTAGGLLKRVATGAAASTVTGEVTRQAENASLPDSMQTPFSGEDVAMNAGMGALMGGALGPRESRSIGQGARGDIAPEAPPSDPVSDVEKVQEAARTQASTEGADPLDQELAAASEGAKAGALHDHAFVEDAKDLAVSNQQQQAELNDRQDRLDALDNLIAGVKEDESTPLTQSTPQTFADAFQVKEQADAAQKESELNDMEFQQHIQKGVESEFAAPEESGATLADVMPPEIRNIGKKPAEEPSVVQKTEPAKEPANPLALRAEINEQAHEAATSPKNDLPEPTDAQIEAGNYKKGHVNVQGLDISIENPEGSTRSGVSPSGEPWSTKLRDHYGYIRQTEGADGDHVDAFVGPHPDSDKVYVIDQVKQDNGAFDEHKAMVGYNNQLDAVRAYKRNFPKGWEVGPVNEMTMDEFKDWTRNGDTTKPVTPIQERTPATAEQVADIAGNGKRGQQKVRYRLQEPDALANNASGESAASQEAVNRVAQEKELGQDRYLLDRDGTVRPLTGVDAVDIPAREGQVIVQRNVGDKEWTITDRGDMSSMRANGMLNGVRDQLPGGAREASGIRARRAESTPKSSVTKEQVTEALNKRAGELPIEVHDSPETMPEGAAKENYEKEAHPDAKGFYDTETGTAHVFADRHASVEDAIKTGMHELGHKAVRAVLGDRFNDVMDDIYKNGNQEAIKNTAEKYGLDLKNPEEQRIAAEEHIGSIAERPDNSPLLRRVVDAVRSGLRRLGVVRGWTDNDIKGLLRNAHQDLIKNGLTKEAVAVRKVRYALGDKVVDQVNKTPDNPISRLTKYAAITQKPNFKYSPTLLRRVRDKVSQFGREDGIQKLLGAMQLDKMPDFISKDKAPAVDAMVSTARKMSRRRNELISEYAPKVNHMAEYTKKNPTGSARLGELMHASTLAGVDPSKEFTPRLLGEGKTLQDKHLETERRATYSALKPYWDRLDPEAKRIFNETRDAHVAQRTRELTALENRINDSDASPTSKRVLLDEMRRAFETGNVEGPYFPLSRFGDYWAAAKNKAGETISASRFETAAEQREYRQHFNNQGFDTDGGKNSDQQKMLEHINPEFVAKVADLTKGMGSEVTDAIWQHYLSSLPEMSMRKANMHRQGRLGFSNDIVRSFANSMYHGAHQQAKLEYGHKLEGQLQQLEKQTKTLETNQDPEAKWARALTSEMTLRHQWMMNPKDSQWSSALTSLGFVYHLAVSPAAISRHGIQLMHTAMPVLAGEHGFGRANREIIKAAAQVAGARIGSLGKIDIASKLSGDEQRAMLEAERAGVFAQTQAHALSDLTNEHGYITGGARKQFMQIVSWATHKAEEFGRKTTFLSAFRLAKQKMGDNYNYESAFENADKLTSMGMFDPSNANRARYLQSNSAKVAFMFKNFTSNVYYRLGRDFKDSISGTTPEQRGAAQRRFVGLMGMTALISGAVGMGPLWGAYTTVMNALFKTDDNTFDATRDTYAYLVAHLGSKGAQAVMKGPLEAATGLGVSDQVGLSNVFLHDPPENETGAAEFKDYAIQMLGETVQTGSQFYDAAKLYNQGFPGRATEKVIPKGLGGDLLKAARYANEGVVDTKGNVTMAKGKLNDAQLAAQASGFVPAELQQHYEQNRAVQDSAQKLELREKLLMDKYQMALKTDDSDSLKEVNGQLSKFWTENPTMEKSGKQVLASLMAHAKFNARAVEGVTIPNNLGYLHQKYKFTPDEAPAQ